MSSELRARLAQLGPVRDITPARSSSAAPVPVLLRRIGSYHNRISVFRRLFDDGVTARAAKDAIDMLAARDWTICPIPGDTDMTRLAADLLALDVQVELRRPEQPETGAWIAAVRERHTLSQRDFADRLGFDVRTLQNWEQGRNRPDSAVLSLIRLFDRDPALVLSAVYEPIA